MSNYLGLPVFNGKTLLTSDHKCTDIRTRTQIGTVISFKVYIVTRAGNNNFHTKSPTANDLITCLLAFRLTVHAKSTREHTLQHNVSPLYILYYAYISYSLLAITVLALVRVSHSNITVIHFSSRTLAHAITTSSSLQISYPFNPGLKMFPFWAEPKILSLLILSISKGAPPPPGVQ